MGRLDVRSMIESFKIQGGLTVTRRAAGTRTNGFYTDGTTTTFTLDPVIVQPAGPKELRQLPEGLRTQDALVLHSTILLRTASEPNGYLADRISYQGATYEVQALEDWTSIVDYYRAIATKIPTT